MRSHKIQNTVQDAQETWRSQLSCFKNISPLYRDVLKCSIAYFVASLFTFSPHLSSLMYDLVSYGSDNGGPTPSGHLVATIAVYYNPAKTVGGMVEADFFCFLGLLYSSTVCLVSMTLFWWLESKPGWEWLGNAIAVAWVGVSVSIMAWLKVWMASPSFNTACSMTAIIIFIVLVKEGGLFTLLHVSTNVLCGSLISNIVCYFMWPRTATANLEKHISLTLDSFSTLLRRITDVFLLDDYRSSDMANHEKIHKAVKDHQNSFTILKRDLNEARSEWLPWASSNSDKSWTPYENSVESMNRLAQHLSGLRSSIGLQLELAKSEPSLDQSATCSHQPNAKESLGQSCLSKTPEAALNSLIDDLRPPLKALSSACVTALFRLHESFKQLYEPSQDEVHFKSGDFIELVEAVEKALVRFESTSNHAILRHYKRNSDVQRILYPEVLGTLGLDEKDDMGQNLEPAFLVYFFIFTLQEFAHETVLLIECIEKVYLYEQWRTRSALWFRLYSKVWEVKHWWNRGLENRRASLKRRLCGFSLSCGLSHLLFLVSAAYMIRAERKRHPGFPKVNPHAPNTVQTPSWHQLSGIARYKQMLWILSRKLTEPQSKYAIKAGLATAMLASPAFFDTTRPLFIDYWGDWALISFFVVISPTIGATNHLSLQRVLGTLSGATIAVIVFTLFSEDPITLSIFGFCFSVPCFYVAISRPQYVSASRFILLTYNLTCLYSYNCRQKEVAILDIAIHRAISVTAGVVWAAIISRLWWPAEARRELGKALGEFCLNLGWLYTRLVASNSFTSASEEATGELAQCEDALLASGSGVQQRRDSVKEFMAMELHLQLKLFEVQVLLAQTQHEPRLKGPFPVDLYRDVLTSLQTILDKLHSMRCVTTKEECVRNDFILPVNKQRREMVGNIILTLSILAAAFQLKTPLPPYLPPCEKSRQQLVDAICNLEVVKHHDIKVSRQLLFFAYAITMKGVTNELEFLGRTLQRMFGVIGHSPEEFERLFVMQEELLSSTV
ncbi:hypothetical protein AMATHDRAFT_155264 [Amanita thiersii Skay4041]|uniref:Uncharacterized protein n=1 Tax=Amanita thiersii Skay4041 TaxID=703135 RepID=A0A2A9NFA8_9AGAR|nr:hypothetical protein AMATHDRAFT_155264 [Amanita thiersii Skay4041]